MIQPVQMVECAPKTTMAMKCAFVPLDSVELHVKIVRFFAECVYIIFINIAFGVIIHSQMHSLASTLNIM